MEVSRLRSRAEEMFDEVAADEYSRLVHMFTYLTGVDISHASVSVNVNYTN